VGLSDLAERPLSDLSGGQRQRTFFARALAQAPEVFLLDEPFSGVDYETERWLVDHLRTLAANGKTAFIVHHDVTSVQRIFEHVVLLNVGVFAAGRVDEVWSEQTLRRTFHPEGYPEGT
jgi:manganese/zinc/iron transport system ATP- binding protein